MSNMITQHDLTLYLPFPPTVNNYYVKTRNGVFISAKGKRYRAEVLDDVMSQAAGVELDTRLYVTVILHMPDKRKRDLDNYMKALLDAITEAALWEDDSQIDQLNIYRGEDVKGGLVRMMISEGGPRLKKGQWP